MSRALLMIFLISLAPELAAQDPPSPGAYLMDEAEELRLAATAGPKAVTVGASYYVLRPGGFERVTKGTNGFHCFVERSWGTPTDDHRIVFDPRVKAPHCINQEGAETTMQEIFLTAELVMEAKSADEVREGVDRAFASGELRLPRELSLTYMMSKHQWLGPGIEAWRPHLMIWIPYLEASEIGVQAPGSPYPLVAGRPGSRKSVLIVPVPSFIE